MCACKKIQIFPPIYFVLLKSFPVEPMLILIDIKVSKLNENYFIIFIYFNSSRYTFIFYLFHESYYNFLKFKQIIWSDNFNNKRQRNKFDVVEKI